MDARIVIKVNQKDKVDPLLEFLKSIDYISSIECFNELVDFKKKLDDVNQIARSTDAAEEKIEYRSRPKSTKTNLISSISSALKKDGRVSTAWLFGSVAR